MKNLMKKFLLVLVTHGLDILVVGQKKKHELVPRFERENNVIDIFFIFTWNLSPKFHWNNFLLCCNFERYSIKFWRLPSYEISFHWNYEVICEISLKSKSRNTMVFPLTHNLHFTRLWRRIRKNTNIKSEMKMNNFFLVTLVLLTA